MAFPLDARASADSVFCYECSATRIDRPQYNEEGCRLCPECGSDFVELVAPAIVRPAPVTTSTGVSTTSIPSRVDHMAPMDFTRTARLPTGGTARVSVRVIQAPMTMDGLMSSDLPAILAQAGAQGAAVLGVQVNGDGTMSTPVHMNFGDFASSAGMEQLLDQLAQQYQPASDPATRAVVEALPKRRVPPLEKDAPTGAGGDGQEPINGAEEDRREQDFAACRPGDPCSVCHSPFEAGETVTQLDCHHCFHGDCILPWLEANNTCPVCRSQLPRELPGAHNQQHSTDSAAANENAQVAAQVDELLDTVASRMQQAALASARADLGTTGALPAQDSRATADSRSGVESGGATTQAPASAATVGDEPTDAANTVAEGDESGVEQVPRGQGQAESPGAMGWLGRAAWWVARTAMRRGSPE